MDGIILIDKPQGLTSHQVVAIVRKKLGVKKVGHAGTLDPLATGLLIIMVGKATKLSNNLIQESKTYEAEMKLFLETDSGDITGKVISTVPEIKLEISTINKIFNSFNQQKYQQTPPIFSAIKVKGKKLYEYARKNLPVTIPVREVYIEELSFLDYQEELNTIRFRVKCSKGTYVRSLALDIAKRLGTISTITELRRITSGDFYLEKAFKLEDIKPNEDKIFFKN